MNNDCCVVSLACVTWKRKSETEAVENETAVKFDILRIHQGSSKQALWKASFFYKQCCHDVFSSFSSNLFSTPIPSFYRSPPLQIPSAGQLMEALRVKMKERKVLTEELAALAAPVSEKAWLPGLTLGKLSSSSLSSLLLSFLCSRPIPCSAGVGLSQMEPRKNQYLWGKRRSCRLTPGPLAPTCTPTFLNEPSTSALALTVLWLSDGGAPQSRANLRFGPELKGKTWQTLMPIFNLHL